MDINVIKSALIETFIEMMGADKAYEVENYINSMSDKQIITLKDNFMTSTVPTSKKSSDENAVDTFVTKLIQNMNKNKVSTTNQIDVIDGTLSALKNGKITITNNTNG